MFTLLAAAVIIAIVVAIALVYVGVKMERAANRSASQFASVTNGRSNTRYAHGNSGDHFGE